MALLFEVKNALFIAREIQQNKQIGLRHDTKKQRLMLAGWMLTEDIDEPT